MRANFDTIPPASAADQAAMPCNRGERRAKAALARNQTPPPEVQAPPSFAIDPAQPETWPSLMRVSDICRDPRRGYSGILPLTRSAFLTAVEDRYIAKPVKLGAKVVAWRREDILHIVQHGVVGRREQGRRAKARAAQRQAAEAASR